MIRHFRTKRQRIEAIPVTERMLLSGGGWPEELEGLERGTARLGDWLIRTTERNRAKGPWVLITPEHFDVQFEED